MEPVGDDHRVRQSFAGNPGVDGGQVDRHMGDRSSPCGIAMCEPVDHHGGVSAVDLPEQSLVAGDVDQAGVPAIHPHPPPGVGVGFPLGFAAAGLVDAEHRHRGRLSLQGRIGGGDDLIVHGVPTAPIVTGHRDHRAGLVEDLNGHHRLRPRGDPRPSRHPGD